EISDSFPNLFVPAGITFSIWGLIYLFLLGFLIYQSKDLFKYPQDSTPWFSKIGPFFLLTCIANITWIFSWHYHYVEISVGVMVSFLVLLIIIYQRLGIGQSVVSSGVKWFVHTPFSIYLGWITVATIANVTALLVSINWDGFGISEIFWTVGMIFIATLIGQKMLNSRGDIAYSLVLIWAFAGIILKQKGVEQNIVIAASIGTVLILLSLLPIIIRTIRGR
ncbi:hypothetical protein OAU89_03180, partial [bacterium]|nr:hypothetical protein [bacterium]